jgi:hypothetical protein
VTNHEKTTFLVRWLAEKHNMRRPKKQKRRLPAEQTQAQKIGWKANPEILRILAKKEKK